MSKLGGTRPSLILFLSHSDGNQCCAQTYERMIFRDKTVVDMAKEAFLCIRLDRTQDVAKPFGPFKGPVLLVQDTEGEEVARFITCTEVRWVIDVMKLCLQRQRETVTKSAEFAPKIARAERASSEGKNREASDVIAKARKEPRLSRFLRDKAVAIEKELGARAQAMLDEGKAKEAADDAGGAFKLYARVRDEFWGLPFSVTAKDAIKALEKDPAKKARLREARAESLVEQAREIAASGGKNEALKLLRKVTGDYSDTAAATAAKAFIAELNDPSWKPSAPAPKAEEKPAPAPAEEPAAPQPQPEMPVPPAPPEEPVPSEEDGR